LFGGHEDGEGQRPEELARIWAYVHGLIRTRLQNGIFTALDATNLKPKDREAVLKQVPPGVLVQYVVIDRDLDEKLAQRGWRSEELILRHHKAFRLTEREVLDADGKGNVIVVDARQ
jgi:predicted kinase